MVTENFSAIKAEIESTLVRQKEFFQSGATLDIGFRKKQLIALKKAIVNNMSQIYEALYKDLQKSEFEAYSTEIGFVLEEIGYAIKRLRSWTKPVKVHTPLTCFAGKSFYMYQPYGTVLIIAPWNYPFQLLFAPLVGAIAAGNTVVLKSSPYVPNVSQVMKNIIEQTFETKYIAYFEGHRDVNQALLEQSFDMIFFTGSPSTGKIVMEYAAKHLTPVVLELGGKSPTIVDSDAKIRLAAKSIVWGKLINAGQTCIAPDYLLVHSAVKNELLEKMKYFIEKFYTSEQNKVNYYPKIVNEQNVDRLYSYLKCGKIYYGGIIDRSNRYFQPTILTDVDPECSVMQEEIFGPIFPVIEFSDLEQVVKLINSKPKPLAFYYFGRNKHRINYLLSRTTSGGMSVNDTLMHFVNPHLPFGGVGNSGMGRYHGWFSFKAFSNIRSVYKKSLWIDLPVRYLPPKKWKLNTVKKLLK